ncbi:MAG: prepilin peptidase [Firmicutes bacterium HGW-Firmicutes-13]|nr:MAG: prepilin peptidase [Firmicutes bacterium HGW-Firmicutes-13]
MLEIIITVMGLIIGSFLNVCIYRLPRRESVVFGSSYCPECEQSLRPLDLIPVFSYFILEGKCRYCNEKINIRYPFIELLTGAVFLITFLTIGFNINLIKYLFLFSALIVVFFIDVDHEIIPNQLVLVIFTWGLLWQLFWPEISWADALGGAFLGGGLLLLASLISRGGMGGGDIKLMFAAGFYLGTILTGLALFLGFISGSVVGIVLILLKVKKRKDYIPFGPFLSFGIFVTVLWGINIVNFYLYYINVS